MLDGKLFGPYQTVIIEPCKSEDELYVLKLPIMTFLPLDL
jgi:hypothetical protein